MAVKEEIVKTILIALLCIALAGCQKSTQDSVTVQLLKDDPKATKAVTQTEAMTFAKSKWDRNEHGRGEPDGLVRDVQPITSPLFSEYLPRCQIFRVTVFNPASAIAGRSFFPHAMVIQDEQPCFIDCGKAATDFLSTLGLSVTNELAARDVVQLFADLRDYKLAEREDVPDGKGLGNSSPEDWKVRVSRSGESWVVVAPFMCDPVIDAYGQWKLIITREGSVRAEFVKLLFARDGYA